MSHGKGKPSSQAVISDHPSVLPRPFPLSTHTKHRPNKHAVVLLKASLVRLSERDTKLLSRVSLVEPQSQGSELQSSEKPHQRIGSNTVLGFRVGALVMREEALEGVGLGWIGEEVGANFLLSV